LCDGFCVTFICVTDDYCLLFFVTVILNTTDIICATDNYCLFFVTVILNATDIIYELVFISAKIIISVTVVVVVDLI
jgi:hypothetical protein